MASDAETDCRGEGERRDHSLSGSSGVACAHPAAVTLGRDAFFARVVAALRCPAQRVLLNYHMQVLQKNALDRIILLDLGFLRVTCCCC